VPSVSKIFRGKTRDEVSRTRAKEFGILFGKGREWNGKGSLVQEKRGGKHAVGHKRVLLSFI